MTEPFTPTPEGRVINRSANRVPPTRRFASTSPLALLLVVSAVVFLAELAIMLIVLRRSALSPLGQAILDSVLVVLLAFPALYFFSFRPLVRLLAENQRVEAERLETVVQLAQAEKLAAESETREVRWQLSQATKLAAVGQLAAGVAHELNNPLTSVVSFAEFLLVDLGPGAEPTREAMTRWRPYAEKIRGAAERCRVIVQGLLDFARPGTSERLAVDLAELVSRVVSIIGNQLKVQETTLTVAMGDGLVIDAAPNKIEQVLLNVMLNAAQALGRGGEIRVTAERREKTIRLRIADSGPGIAKESLARVFDPFFTTKPVGTGTGLGLAVSWGIMNDHGGEIEVESESGKGSCFTLIFPIEGA